MYQIAEVTEIEVIFAGGIHFPLADIQEYFTPSGLPRSLPCGYFNPGQCGSMYGTCDGCQYAESVKCVKKPAFKIHPHQVLVGLHDSDEWPWIKKGEKYTVMLVGEMYVRFSNQLNFPLEGIENMFSPEHTE